MSKLDKNQRNLPYWFWLGLVLTLLFWYVNWGVEGMRTHYGFFPLWLGYILSADGLCFYRKGHSLLSRSKTGFLSLFVISAPAWWLFEIFNERTAYWHYTGREEFSDLEYFLFASLSFSTVIPAVFESSELIGSFRWLQKLGKGPGIGKSRGSILFLFISGLVLLVIVFVFPEYSAAFIWMSLYLILDPVNHWLGNRTLIGRTGQRDWREVMALWTGCLICGFFWEMWNYYSEPKWYYTVPYVDFWYVFEMPLLGYLGYLPFALELFVIYHLLMGLLPDKKWQHYLQLLPGKDKKWEA
ncbi:MAG: hypothetical protein ACLFUB_12745 [Cyclobacteriaceae bacterium]